MRALIIFCLLVANPSSFATDATSESSTGASTTTKTNTTSASSPIVTPVSTSPSINPSANAGKSSQSGGSAANMAAAAALMAACMASVPPNIALCMMGALAAMQGGSDSGAADQSATTAAATNLNPATASSAASVAAAGSGSSGLVSPTIAAGLNAIKDAGYSVTPTTVTSPDGTTTPAASFSPSSLSGTLSADQIKEANKVLAQVNADALRNAGKTSMAVDGGGGGPASAPGGGGSEDRVKVPSFKNPFAVSPDAAKQMVAGKTVLFNGDPIGTRGGNIFDQIHEAYGRQKGAANFIEGEGDNEIVNVRAPASTRPLTKPAPPKK